VWNVYTQDLDKVGVFLWGHTHTHKKEGEKHKDYIFRLSPAPPSNWILAFFTPLVSVSLSIYTGSISGRTGRTDDAGDRSSLSVSLSCPAIHKVVVPHENAYLDDTQQGEVARKPSIVAQALQDVADIELVQFR